ncbi:MAG: DNRLRE domain-containing protein, partial [Clostridia bacterium]|nr:DNRLRE domain-containing protein [Clostridia bacterium]
MSKVFKKVVASMLTIAISLTTVDLISVKAYAKETSDAIKEEQKLKETDEEIDAYIDELVDDGKEWEENDKKATTNSITYELVDGIEKTVFYSDDVRYKNSKGDLVDYDSTLKGVSRKVTGGNNDLNDYVYENTLGNSKNYFPENVSIETPVLLEKEKYSVKVSPIENQTNDSELEDDKNVETTAEVSNKVSVDKQKGKENKNNIKRERKNLKTLSKGKVIEDKVKDIYNKKADKKVGMKYVSKEDNMAYEYISSEHGVKENIILDEVPETNVFSFSLELEGLIAKKDTCVEGISFFDENEDIVGGIQIPFMNDATGKAYSEDITYTLTDLGEGKYVVDMTVSEDYLKDKKREYPVTIDPTVTWTGTSYMYDTYVANNSYKTENFYSSSVTLLRVGVLPSGSAVTRSLLHWPKIASTVNDKYISSAKLSLYETGSGAASMKVRAYRVLSSWNKSTVTWNTQPTIDSSCYATLTTTGSAGSANTVSVKTFVQDIANESKSNYGLMLKNTNESVASKYVGYYNSRYTANAAYKPKMV